MRDEAHVLEHEPLQVALDLTYEVRPIRILGAQDTQLRRWVIRRVLVQWEYHTPREAMGARGWDARALSAVIRTDRVVPDVRDELFIWGGDCYIP